jgi:heterodisulfide reductase subunit C
MKVKLSHEEINNENLLKILELSGAKISACYQCGKCTAGCPTSDFMDIPPHQVIRLLQLGQVGETLEKNTIWLCASCITCAVRCPKGVDLSKIMEALRQLSLRRTENYIDPDEMTKENIEKFPQIALIANFRKFTR